MGTAAIDTDGTRSRGTRCIAITGPFLSGKTTLLEAILARTGAIPRAGRVSEGTTVGDASPEARTHILSVEATFAETTFMDEPYAFVDLPGSVEFQADAAAILPVCDAAIVVCEPEAKRVPALQATLKSLASRKIPHLLFLNKMDTTTMHVRDIVPLLQPASEIPLVLRQIPIWEGDVVKGYVDLASERAYVYRDGAPSEMIAMPSSVKDRENEARFHMLEQLADHDEQLMEQLLTDVTPGQDRIFDDLAREMRDGLICPVFIGSALKGNGIFRLLKALRHEAPTIAETATRLGVAPNPSAIHVMKTLHQPHAGKLSVARILRGGLRDGEDVRHGTHT
ncbi:MAG TPA: GTP-binding protein, partial [Hyphomicrobiaceae bacterium]|nr:GTP-binding protein [Hyphomicrobiaceae bacterium]